MATATIGSVARLVRTLIRDEGAQDLVEYGVALAIISALAGAIAVSVQISVGQLWAATQGVIQAAL